MERSRLGRTRRRSLLAAAPPAVHRWAAQVHPRRRRAPGTSRPTACYVPGTGIRALQHIPSSSFAGAPARPARRPLVALPAPSATSGSSSSTPAPSTCAARSFKRLTPEEMVERRKLGLCYNCDEQFIHEHKCVCLFYLEVPDYIIEEPDDDPPAEQPSFDLEKSMISLSTVTGIRARDTMQLHVRIGAHEFTALLDSGSTHNFINPDAASPC